MLQKIIEKLIWVSAGQWRFLRTCNPDPHLDVVEANVTAKRGIQLIQPLEVKRRLLSKSEPLKHAFDEGWSERRFRTGSMLRYGHKLDVVLPGPTTLEPAAESSTMADLPQPPALFCLLTPMDLPRERSL